MYRIAFLLIDGLHPTGYFGSNIDLFGLYLSLQIGRFAIAKEVDRKRDNSCKYSNGN